MSQPIEDVLKNHAQDLLALPGVVGTAQGLREDMPCIKVFTASPPPETLRRIPSTLEGYPVVREETGELRAF